MTNTHVNPTPRIKKDDKTILPVNPQSQKSTESHKTEKAEPDNNPFKDQHPYPNDLYKEKLPPDVQMSRNELNNE